MLEDSLNSSCVEERRIKLRCGEEEAVDERDGEEEEEEVEGLFSEFSSSSPHWGMGRRGFICIQ